VTEGGGGGMEGYTNHALQNQTTIQLVLQVDYSRLAGLCFVLWPPVEDKLL
jgi:hypothetical protein